MPSCSVKQCRARKHKNQPQLSIHRLPQNEDLRRKWLKVIGPENINPRHKQIRVCSLHFEESSFNKTLNVVRLREDAVPSIHIVPSHKADDHILCETSNVRDREFSTITKTHNISNEHIDTVQKVNQETTESTRTQKNQSTKSTKIENCDELRKKINRLNEKIRRQANKIANLEDIISDLKSKVIINTDES